MPNKRAKRATAQLAASSTTTTTTPQQQQQHTETTAVGTTTGSTGSPPPPPPPLQRQRPKAETITGESGELFKSDTLVVNTTGATTAAALTTITTTTMTTGMSTATTGLIQQAQPQKDETTAMDVEVPKFSDNDKGIVYVALDGYMSQVMKIKVCSGNDIDDIKEEIKRKGSPVFDSIAAFEMKVYQSIQQTTERKSNDEETEKPLTPVRKPMNATIKWDSEVTWGTEEQPLIVHTPQPPINTSAPFEYESKTLGYLLKIRCGVIPELAKDNQCMQL